MNFGVGRRRKFMQRCKLVMRKWNKIVRNFKVGDIIFLWDETSRNKWPLGRVMAIQEGNDGFVQSV